MKKKYSIVSQWLRGWSPLCCLTVTYGRVIDNNSDPNVIHMKIINVYNKTGRIADRNENGRIEQSLQVGTAGSGRKCCHEHGQQHQRHYGIYFDYNYNNGLSTVRKKQKGELFNFWYTLVVCFALFAYKYFQIEVSFVSNGNLIIAFVSESALGLGLPELFFFCLSQYFHILHRKVCLNS